MVPAGRRTGAGADPVEDPPERRRLRETVRDIVSHVSPPDRVLQLDEAEQFDEELFTALAEVGILALDSPTDRDSGTCATSWPSSRSSPPGPPPWRRS